MEIIMMMDFLTNKEIDGLKGDINAKGYAVRSAQYAFAQELKNGLKESIIQSLKDDEEKQKRKALKVKKKSSFSLFKKRTKTL